jgi:hypothetical protein
MLFAAADPNWFYSTLAQATAALVGLAGAFLVQQLLNQRAEISPVRTDIRQDLKQLRLTIEKDLRYVEVGLDSLTEAFKLKEWRRSGPGVAPLNVQALEPERGSVSGELSLPFIEDAQAEAILTDAVDRISALRDEMKAVSWEGLAEAVRIVGHLPAPAQGWLADPNLIPRPAWEAVAPGTGLWPRLEMQGDYAAQWWRAYDRQVGEIGERVESLRSKLAPQSLYILFGILGSLLAVGVIGPLFYLSAEGGISKPFFLVFFIPLALAFVGFYGYELRRLRRADRLLSEDF